jgi:hypothetical protein
MCVCARTREREREREEGERERKHIKAILRIFYERTTNTVALVLERTIPTERPPLVGEVSVKFVTDRGCHVVSLTDPHGRILDFLDQIENLLYESKIKKFINNSYFCFIFIHNLLKLRNIYGVTTKLDI